MRETYLKDNKNQLKLNKEEAEVIISICVAINWIVKLPSKLSYFHHTKISRRTCCICHFCVSKLSTVISPPMVICKTGTTGIKCVLSGGPEFLAVARRRTQGPIAVMQPWPDCTLGQRSCGLTWYQWGWYHVSCDSHSKWAFTPELEW